VKGPDDPPHDIDPAPILMSRELRFFCPPAEGSSREQGPATLSPFGEPAPPLPKSVQTIFNGLVALALALIVWRVTHSFLGWLVLFLPGAGLVFWGLFLVWKER
jgi:hypothetical protein